MNDVEFKKLKEYVFSIDTKTNELKREFLVGSPSKDNILKEATSILNDIVSIIDVCK